MNCGTAILHQAKKLLMDKVLNVQSVGDILDGLRSDLVRTIKHGMILVLRMANSAVDFRRQFAAPCQFPAAVFDPNAIREERTFMQLVQPADTTQGYAAVCVWNSAWAFRQSDFYANNLSVCGLSSVFCCCYCCAQHFHSQVCTLRPFGPACH
jgi:hypothetical protein